MTQSYGITGGKEHKAWRGPEGLGMESLTIWVRPSWTCTVVPCHICHALPATTSPPFTNPDSIQESISTRNICLHDISPLQSIFSMLMATGLRKLSFKNHVPQSVRQIVYTFYLNNISCKPVSCEISISSYFKASLKGNDFFSCSYSI